MSNRSEYLWSGIHLLQDKKLRRQPGAVRDRKELGADGEAADRKYAQN